MASEAGEINQPVCENLTGVPEELEGIWRSCTSIAGSESPSPIDLNLELIDDIDDLPFFTNQQPWSSSWYCNEWSGQEGLLIVEEEPQSTTDQAHPPLPELPDAIRVPTAEPASIYLMEANSDAIVPKVVMTTTNACFAEDEPAKQACERDRATPQMDTAKPKATKQQASQDHPKVLAEQAGHYSIPEANGGTRIEIGRAHV